jgi:quercetin dioxygenase-like cupin family protein
MDIAGEAAARTGKAAGHPLDAMAVSTDNHAVLLENEQVRVLDTWIAPGRRTAVHSHEWPSTLYVVSWSDFVRYDAEGQVLVDSRQMPARPAAGSVLWSPPLPPHCVANVGDGELRVIAVEVKGA